MNEQLFTLRVVVRAFPHIARVIRYLDRCYTECNWMWAGELDGLPEGARAALLTRVYGMDEEIDYLLSRIRRLDGVVDASRFHFEEVKCQDSIELRFTPVRNTESLPISQSGLEIVLIDDQCETLKLRWDSIFKARGINVKYFEYAEDALAYLENLPESLVFLDHFLRRKTSKPRPEQDGLEVADKMSTLAGQHDVYVCTSAIEGGTRKEQDRMKGYRQYSFVRGPIRRAPGAILDAIAEWQRRSKVP